MKLNKNARKIQKTVLALAVALLSACGGGGGDTAAVPPATPPVVVVPPVVTPPVVIPGQLLMTMPPNPYPANSAEFRNFAELNRLRIAGGFGAAVYDPVLAQAAKNHVNYWILNPIKVGDDFHAESPALPGFTGVSMIDRQLAAGVAAGQADKVWGGEFGTGSSWTLDTLDVMGLYTGATAHLQGALAYEVNRVGMYFAGNVADGNLPVNHATVGAIETGSLNGLGISLDSDKDNMMVGIYPFDGMTNVGTGGPAAGGPLSILVEYPRTHGEVPNPTVITFTLRKDGAATDTPTVIHEAGKPHGFEPTAAGWAIMYPLGNLDVNSTYTVNFVGSKLGVVSKKTWSFTTGASAMSVAGG